jgi:trk system potassium uptake protein TrkH
VRVLGLGDVTHLVGTVLLGVAAALAVTALAGLGLRDGSAVPLAISALIAGAAGAIARRFTHPPEGITFQEAFATVSFSWVAVAIVGALPYMLSGAIPGPIEALFESASGFTTTGSTVLADIEVVAPGILLWRSVTQWLGGMGFIVLGVAVLPYLGVGGMQLFRLEAPGPTADRLRPRIRETAKLLWMVYAVLTVVLIALYAAAGMSVLDAVNHAFTTMPTGGFSTRNASMAPFAPAIQWICIVFMYIAGASFTLHYRALGRGPRAYLRDTEWRLYTSIAVAGSVVVAFLIADDGRPLGHVIREAAFQVVSVLTTTGYATADYALWVPAAQLALFLMFFLGGMGGSTAGGVKMLRVLQVL